LPMSGAEDTEALLRAEADPGWGEVPQIRRFHVREPHRLDRAKVRCNHRLCKVAAPSVGVLLVVLMACLALRGLRPGRWLFAAGGVVGEVGQGRSVRRPQALAHRACAGDGESCLESRCCEMGGLQCYEKSPEWAACRPSCSPGPDLADVDASPWSCRKLGRRAAGDIPTFEYNLSAWVKETCAGPGQNCTQARCCSQEGDQCYVKNSAWAGCRAGCTPGPSLEDPNDDPWTCEELGPRTPGEPTKPSGVVSKWVLKSCSGPNEDCRGTRCCRDPGVQCFAKNSHWAACKPRCAPGPDEFDVDDDPWSCAPLGSSWTVTTTTTTSTRTAGSPSLFCFSVSRNFGPEPEILAFQHESRAGIFGCDETAVFCTGPLTVGEGHEAVDAIRFADAPVGRSRDGTAGNALLFMHVWDAVSREGRWMSSDWTVKADPDAVILPDRLRDHLRPHGAKSTFMRNCNAVPSSPDYPEMYGALEAISRKALGTYLAQKARCDAGLDWASLGEDVYLQKCLIYLGIPGDVDLKIVGDNLCTGATCYDSAVAGFHPFKTREDWKGCWGSALGLW